MKVEVAVEVVLEVTRVVDLSTGAGMTLLLVIADEGAMVEVVMMIDEGTVDEGTGGRGDGGKTEGEGMTDGSTEDGIREGEGTIGEGTIVEGRGGLTVVVVV